MDSVHDRLVGMENSRVLVSGSTGFLGTALVAVLKEAGFSPARLLRSQRSFPEETFPWNPAESRLDPAHLEDFEAIIHLSGENVADGVWTRDKKHKILQSRIDSTRLLVEGLRRVSKKPAVLLCASAIGWYGNRGTEILPESEPCGRGFLADVAREWEKEACRAKEYGIRVIKLRLGLVLDSYGGALPRILTPFRLGLGGPLSDGSQYVSWITLRDTLNAILFLMTSTKVEGPANLCAPGPVTNAEFSTQLGKALNRPALIPTPAFALKLSLGDMAKELLLSSIRAEPKALLDQGFEFQDPKIEGAFQTLVEVL